MYGSTVLLVLQLAMAAMLCWSCLCRVTKTNGDTRREVRWALVAEGAAAGLLFGAPFLPVLMPGDARWPPGTTPMWVWVIMLATIVNVTFHTARYWAQGVPSQFQTDRRQPPGRNMAMALVAMAACVLALVPADRADATGAEPARAGVSVDDVHLVLPGQMAGCPLGGPPCVAMTAEAFRELMDLVHGKAGTTLTRGQGCLRT